MRRMLDPKELGGSVPSTITFDSEGNRTVGKNLGVDGKLTLKSLVSASNPDGDITKELGGGGGSLPSTITFDKDGNRTVGKNLTVNENLSVNSFKNSRNIDGSPDNRYSQFNKPVYVPDSDVDTSSYEWHWITRQLDQDITNYSGFIEMHNWYELYSGSKKHEGYITCDFFIEWKSSSAYNGVSSVELPVGFNGWLLQPYKSWKGWAYSVDYYGGIVKMTTGGKEYPVKISVKDHTLHFTATGESITIPANTPIRFEGRFFQRRT